MVRKARAEVEGGLYHVITRGNNRRQIFNSPADYEKFLLLLAVQKTKLPFFLYAYCLMTNHVHLLLERQASAVGRIMHLSEIIGVSPSALSRRHDAAREKLRDNVNTRKLASQIIQQYRSGK